MKKTATVIVILIAFIANAQYWNGTYQTNFGTVKLVTENGMVYGDYANNGTILAYEYASGGRVQLHGVFFNGSQVGKFIWKNVSQLNNSVAITIDGYYAYDATITLSKVKQEGGYFETTHFPSKTNEWKWTGSRTSTVKPTDLQSAVWNGKWNTNFGELNLEQTGKTVLGKYKNVGNVDAVFNKNAKTLKGNFTNNGKLGYFQFNFEGNSFKGKWGWNTAMTEGVWEGTKVEKVNKVSTASSSNATSSNANSTTMLQFKLATVFAGDVPHYRNPELYGFAGIKMYRVTQNERVEVKSFGGKTPNFFDRNENRPFPVKEQNYRYDFPDTPDYVREFIVNTDDLNSSHVTFEVEIWHHLKAKVNGPNYDFKKHREVLNVKKLKFESHSPNLMRIGKMYENNTQIGNSKESFIYINFKKN